MTAANPTFPLTTYSPALDRTVKGAIVLVVTLVTSMEFLTSYAVGVALPDIQGDLAASFDEGSWGIAILTILVDRRRSFWSGRLGENISQYNLMAQDALRQGAAALQSVGFPHAQAQAGSMGILHARLLIQSVVNSFADTFAYQAVIGAAALILVTFFARGRAMNAGVRWVVQMTR
jgi:hypothetical protein